MYHRVTFFRPLPIQILIVSRRRRRSGGKLSRLPHIRKQIGRMYIHSIQTRFLSQINWKRNDFCLLYTSISLSQIAFIGKGELLKIGLGLYGRYVNPLKLFMVKTSFLGSQPDNLLLDLLKLVFRHLHDSTLLLRSGPRHTGPWYSWQ